MTDEESLEVWEMKGRAHPFKEHEAGMGKYWENTEKN